MRQCRLASQRAAPRKAHSPRAARQASRRCVSRPTLPQPGSLGIAP